MHKIHHRILNWITEYFLFPEQENDLPTTTYGDTFSPFLQWRFQNTPHPRRSCYQAIKASLSIWTPCSVIVFSTTLSFLSTIFEHYILSCFLSRGRRLHYWNPLPLRTGIESFPSHSSGTPKRSLHATAGRSCFRTTHLHNSTIGMMSGFPPETSLTLGQARRLRWTSP